MAGVKNRIINKNNIYTTKTIVPAVTITPKTLFGKAREMLWYILKYHSGKIWVGVDKGFAVMGLSALPNTSGSQNK